MARLLYCDTRARVTFNALIVEKASKCATCKGPVYWREMDGYPFTLTQSDVEFLKVNRISPE